MIPDYQSLMLPVLELSAEGEVKVSNAVAALEKSFGLTDEEKEELLPSGKQTRFANRVHWARSYLKQAGLVRNTKRGHFVITDTGREVLSTPGIVLDSKYLERFPEFMEFKGRTSASEKEEDLSLQDTTPDEVLRGAYEQITNSLAAEVLARLRESEPDFFEAAIVQLLVKMGYGAGDETGQVIGRSGDDGVDGVINQDPLGVDQVYVQAKRYQAGNNIGSSAIRDFYGALGLKDVSKGIFVTTSAFSASAVSTAEKLGARIVLIDGPKLAKLMISNEIGCRVTETYSVSVIDESYFE